MKRTLTLIAACLAVGSMASSAALAGGSPPTVQLHKTSIGTILVNGRGRTLYMFTKDSRNHDSCQSIAGCLGAWPALTSGHPVAGPGVKSSLLGTIKLKSGAHQVTYNGWPLYLYAGDTRAGQTTYVNILQFGGRWPAVNAAGKPVK